MKIMTKLVLLCLSVFALQTVFAATTPSGYWKTIDDVTGKPKSILHIFEKDHLIYGQVVKIYPKPGQDQNELCTACTGEKHNQPIVGLLIMDGLKLSDSDTNLWSGGQILDPENGKTYRCNIQLIDNGAKLSVRGYIGVPMFGRSQTWLRVSNANGDEVKA